MELKIRIKTPKGSAKKVEKRIQPFLISKKQIKETYTSSDKSTIYWVVQTKNSREYQKILRNVALYDRIINGVFCSKLLKKVIDSKLDDEGRKELKKLLLEQTTVEVIKG